MKKIRDDFSNFELKDGLFGKMLNDNLAYTKFSAVAAGILFIICFILSLSVGRSLGVAIAYFIMVYIILTK